MRYTIEGEEYEFDAKVTVEEAMLIQDKANLGLSEFDPALRKGNPYAIAALILILKKRAGEAVRWQDLMGLDLLTFAIVPEPVEEEPGKPAAPTTSGRGKTRAGATTATS